MCMVVDPSTLHSTSMSQRIGILVPSGSSSVLCTTRIITVMLMLMLLPPLSAAAAAPIGMPGCDTTCGDVSVPYPFGMGPSQCYHSPGFNLTCDRTANNPPRLLLAGDGTLRVASIDDFYVRVMRTGGNIEIDADGRGTFGGGLADDGPYVIDPDMNELIVAGCNVQATLKNGNVTIASCSSLCTTTTTCSNPSGGLKTSMYRCSGVGCCQADIVTNHEEVAGEVVYSASYDVELKWVGWKSTADKAELPPLVFVAEQGWFEQQARISDELAYTNLHPSTTEIPVLLSWAIVEPSLERETNNSVCKKKNTPPHARGYLCFCKDGYQGNPYINGGCHDINECEQEEGRRCDGECINTEGSYECRQHSSTPNGSAGSNSSGCQRWCGDIAVPYPFGINNPSCYRQGFELKCDTGHSGHHPPRLLLGGGDGDMSSLLRVVEISLPNSTVRVLRTGALIFVDDSEKTDGLFYFGDVFKDPSAPYSLSTRNELVARGCNTKATLEGRSGNPRIISGCASFCSDQDIKNYTGVSKDKDNDAYCHGIGCCQARISMPVDGMPNITLWFDRFDINDDIQDLGSMPAYALIAEEGWFDPRNFSGELLAHNIQRQEFPIVLDWEILEPAGSGSAGENQQRYQNCSALSSGAGTSVCTSKHSYCRQGTRGYSCHCSVGYDGNPYLLDGCTAGSGGREREYLKDTVMSVASGAGLVLLVVTAFFVAKKFKHRRAQMLKMKFFEQNRGQLLQQLVSQRADIAEKMIISLEEIEKATNNFDKSRELGGGGHGTVYKGILSDLHVVAIKKPNKVVQREIDEFINEVAILSQINHRNVVKLYGCCLETEVPLLVYEFISNGTLYDHLHVDGPISLAWGDRLRIATETAKSLAYLHSTASIPIIHRDIKSVNILLDDTLTTKVADFGASRYISIEKSGLTTKVQGTIGYLDPMYFYTGRLTEKSDVYSFGVMIVELLTRKKPFSYLSSKGDGLVAHFSTLFAEDNLPYILDPQVMDEESGEVKEVASLAATCIKLQGEDRPTMRQVELALESLWSMKKRALANVVAINCPSPLNGRGHEESSRQRSMEEEFVLSASYPR